MLILTVLVSIGAAFAWTAYREMRQALRLAGEERVHTAAAQLADLLAQAATARVAESRRLASDPAIRRFVLSGEDPEAALVVLRTAAQRSPQAKVRLRASGGTESVHRTIDNVTLDRVPRESDGSRAPAVEGVGPLQVKEGHVTYATSAVIPPPAGESDGGAGVLSIDRPFTASSGVTLIERLIGSGAALKLGNATGDVWTDLSMPVRGPPPLSSGTAAISFADTTGQRRLGTSVPVVATPWHVWVDFSETALMQPADTLLRRMWPWTAGLILLGVLAIGIVSVRITAPLELVAGAAEAMASGDYSRRVLVRRRDEIGRLGSAFNMMADQVADSRDALEARVQARTQELHQSREELDQFFSMSLDLKCVADLEGRFTRVNPAWEAVLGWTVTDLTARPYLDFVHPDDVAATAREAATLSAGGASVNFENRYRCKDGTYRWLSWKASANHARGAIYATARDVTADKQAARDLEQHAAELSASNRELEAFSYSVSHDLRAPLRSIDGFSQALLEDYGDRLEAEGHDYLRRIRAAAQQMGRLIDDMLKLARVTRADLNVEPIDLSAMARTTLAALTDAQHGRTVHWHVHPDLRAVGDARLLQVVLTNLLENAVKFTGKTAQARIEFGERDGNGGREYFVKDNGAGFDPTYAAKLFGAFQRLHHPGDFPGTGIGLATVQRIVTRHGGRVSGEGSVGSGATFTFTLQSEATV
jgi:PAS domain S-box-containing protein